MHCSNCAFVLRQVFRRDEKPVPVGAVEGKLYFGRFAVAAHRRPFERNERCRLCPEALPAVCEGGNGRRYVAHHPRDFRLAARRCKRSPKFRRNRFRRPRGRGRATGIWSRLSGGRNRRSAGILFSERRILFRMSASLSAPLRRRALSFFPASLRTGCIPRARGFRRSCRISPRKSRAA